LFFESWKFPFAIRLRFFSDFLPLGSPGFVPRFLFNSRFHRPLSPFRPHVSAVRRPANTSHNFFFGFFPPPRLLVYFSRGRNLNQWRFEWAVFLFSVPSSGFVKVDHFPSNPLDPNITQSFSLRSAAFCCFFPPFRFLVPPSAVLCGAFQTGIRGLCLLVFPYVPPHPQVFSSRRSLVKNFCLFLSRFQETFVLPSCPTFKGQPGCFFPPVWFAPGSFFPPSF